MIIRIINDRSICIKVDCLCRQPPALKRKILFPILRSHLLVQLNKNSFIYKDGLWIRPEEGSLRDLNVILPTQTVPGVTQSGSTSHEPQKSVIINNVYGSRFRKKRVNLTKAERQREGYNLISGPLKNRGEANLLDKSLVEKFGESSDKPKPAFVMRLRPEYARAVKSRRGKNWDDVKPGPSKRRRCSPAENKFQDSSDDEVTVPSVQSKNSNKPLLLCKNPRVGKHKGKCGYNHGLGLRSSSLDVSVSQHVARHTVEPRNEIINDNSDHDVLEKSFEEVMELEDDISSDTTLPLDEEQDAVGSEDFSEGNFVSKELIGSQSDSREFVDAAQHINLSSELKVGFGEGSAGSKDDGSKVDHSKVTEVASKVSNQSEKERSLVSDAESQIFKIETIGGFGLARRDSLRQEQERRIFYDYLGRGRTSFSRQRQSYGNVGNSVPCSSHQSLR